MRRGAVIFFQTVVVLIGIGVLSFMLWEPQVEGVNAHATNFQIYFNDPFVACAYIASIPFFIALYQVFIVLGYAGQNNALSYETAKALRTIKYCGISLIAFAVLGEMFIMFNDSDDRAGGVFMGVLITFISIVIAVIASKFERVVLQKMVK